VLVTGGGGTAGAAFGVALLPHDPRAAKNRTTVARIQGPRPRDHGLLGLLWLLWLLWLLTGVSPLVVALIPKGHGEITTAPRREVLVRARTTPVLSASSGDRETPSGAQAQCSGSCPIAVSPVVVTSPVQSQVAHQQ
jgi:hypothetical protein